MQKDIIILFGEMGCGKNYWGAKVAAEKGYLFFDGDLAAPQEVIAVVSTFKLRSREQVRLLVRQLCLAVHERAADSPGMVVAQALYFDEDRAFIREELARLGYNVTFQWVCPPFWRNLKQIYSRPKGLKWVVYWLRNKPWFEKPTHDYLLIR